MGIVTVHHLDSGGVERGELSLVPSPCVVSKLMLQLLGDMDGAWCNRDLNLLFPW